MDVNFIAQCFVWEEFEKIRGEAGEVYMFESSVKYWKVLRGFVS